MIVKKRLLICSSLLLLLILLSLLPVSVHSSSETKSNKEAEKISSDSICEYVKLQNKNSIDNATSEACKKVDDAKKKAIGKGKLKKPKGVEIKEKNIIEKQGKATIKFKDSFDVDSEEVGEESGNANIYVGDGIVAINTDEIPELEQPATITLYNLTFESTPTVYYSEEFTTNPSQINMPCPADVCSNINYNIETGTLTFDVAHFSSYAAYQWAVGYNSNNPGACSVDADCKPTAFCAKYVDCQAADYQIPRGGYYFWHEENLCSYKPAAGTENLTCTKYDGIFADYNEPCPEGFESGWASDYYNLRYCSKTESCSTCDGTKACAFDDADRSSYWCQPKTCSSPTGELGKCFDSIIVNNITINYSLGIGQSSCADRNFKVCSNLNDDPCGEWKQTSLGCNAERNDTGKNCYDNTGTSQDYCLNQEILNKYSPLPGQIYDISLTDMYGYSSYFYFGINYSMKSSIQEQKCNITQINCTQYGGVCNSAKRACQFPPSAGVSLSRQNITLNCTAALSDTDEDDKTLYGKYKVTKNNTEGYATVASGTLSCEKDEKTDSCNIQIPLISVASVIFNTTTRVNCSVIPNDGYDDGKTAYSIIFVPPPEIKLTVDREYVEGRGLNYDEYTEQVTVEGKQYVIATEYDSLMCEADGLAGNVNFKIVSGSSVVASASESCVDGCRHKFEGINWPRGDVKYGANSTKLKCVAGLYGKDYNSNETIMIAKHVYTFMHSDNLPYVANAREQFDYYLELSALNYSKAKPIYYGTEYICHISNETPTDDIMACFNGSNSPFGSYNPLYDRIIGMRGVGGGLFDPSTPAVVLIDGNLKTLAHEIGHTYNLADEYSYNDYLKLFNPLNPYPKCAYDHPNTTAEQKAEGNNCWYGSSVSYCYGAGMPLPNHYSIVADLAKSSRSIMGGAELTQFSLVYPSEACYPLTETNCGILGVSAACPLGNCPSGKINIGKKGFELEIRTSKTLEGEIKHNAQLYSVKTNKEDVACGFPCMSVNTYVLNGIWPIDDQIPEGVYLMYNTLFNNPKLDFVNLMCEKDKDGKCRVHVSKITAPENVVEWNGEKWINPFGANVGQKWEYKIITKLANIICDDDGSVSFTFPKEVKGESLFSPLDDDDVWIDWKKAGLNEYSFGGLVKTHKYYFLKRPVNEFFKGNDVVLTLPKEITKGKCPSQEDIKIYLVLGITTYNDKETIEFDTCYNGEVGLMYVKGKNDVIDEKDNINIISNKEALIKNLNIIVNDDIDTSKFPKGVEVLIKKSYSEPKEPDFSDTYKNILSCCGGEDLAKCLEDFSQK